MPLLDQRTELIWQAFKLYLPRGTRLRSVIRPPQAQLAIIVKYAIDSGYKFPRPATLDEPSSWEPALKYIRKKGFEVAAPGSSMHERRFAFDLTHSPTARDSDLQDIETALLKAAADRRITLMPSRPHWPNPKIELKNRCVHVEIKAALLDFEPFDCA